MKRIALIVAASIAGGAAYAQSEIHVCQDADGRKTYQNTGTAKGCKRLDTQPLVTVPAPRVPAARPTDTQRVVPANFPRVDDATQRSRDSDRRRILEDELRAEQQKVERLRSEFNQGEPERRGDERNYARYLERVERLREEIERAESNVTSLQRELALTRQ
jgi:hypothetical protein